jgi:hypothetical protein
LSELLQHHHLDVNIEKKEYFKYMDKWLENRKVLGLIIALAFVTLIALGFKLFYVPPPVEKISQYYTTTGPNVDVAPTLPPDIYGNSGGFDKDSAIAKASQENIAKFKDKLPYITKFVSKSKVPVSVNVSRYGIETSPWIVDAYVLGMDYYVKQGDSNYDKNKSAFVEGANKVFDFIKSNGGDPTKVYINWGDNKAVRDKAREWLAN